MNGVFSEGCQRTVSSALIAASIGAGLAFPGMAAALFPYMLPSLFFLVLFSLSSLDDRATRIIATPDAFTGRTVLWQMFMIPAIVTVGCAVFGASTLLTTILIASTTAGSVFASPALAHIVGLDRTIAVRTMILSTAIMPVSLGVFGELNGILPANMSLRHYILQVAIFLVLPMLVSASFWLLRKRMREHVERRVIRYMGWGSTVSMMVFCLGLMDVIHANKEEHLTDILAYEVIALALAVSIFVVTRVAFARFGGRRALTAGMLAANRNVALSFAMLADVFPPQVIVYVAVVQFPIFLAPLIARLFQVAYSARRLRQRSGGALP